MRQDCETIFQNLAVYFNENLPNVIKISSSSYVQKCDKYLQNKLLKKCKELNTDIIANAAKVNGAIKMT